MEKWNFFSGNLKKLAFVYYIGMLGRILKKKNWKDGCLTANQMQYGFSTLDDCKLNNIKPCVPNIVKPHTTRLMIHCESTKIENLVVLR
jgi:hypothetical protein